MRIHAARKLAKDEDGFMLLEVLMSALVLTIASAGVAAVLVTSVSSSGEQRHGSQAYALAQQDQSRLATMRLANLNHLEQVREIPLNGTTFKVRSYGLWINHETSTQLCTQGASGDYVEIKSVVTWPRMEAAEKAKIVSILSPSGTTSVDPTNGTLPVVVTNERGEPVPNVHLSGTQKEGTGHFEGQTDANGCALFPDIPTLNSSGASRPNYLVTANGEFAGVVNKDGLSTETKEGAAKTESPAILSFRLDKPGTIPVKFQYRVGSTAEFKPATADSLIVFNTGMTAAKVFWTTSGAREATVNPSPLFPFNSPYTIYAGSCTANNPNPKGETNPPGAAAIVSLVAPAGGTATPVTIQLPALELSVKNGSTLLSGAKVTITDTTCKDSKSNYVKRTYTTNASGLPSSGESGSPELGLPWGVYNICASKEISGSIRRKELTSVTVQTLTSATVKSIDLASGYSTGACS